MHRWSLYLFIFSLLIRLISLGAESIWYDESFTYLLATLPIPRLMVATAGDVHPPLWYLLEWLTVRLLGGSEFAIRLPAALFGAAVSAETYTLVKRLTDHRSALAAGVLTAIMPGMIYYGQEARMYTLLNWLVLTSARAALDKNHWRLFPGLSLILYSHNMGALYALPIGLIALWQGRRSVLIPLAGAGGAWLPWVAVLTQQLHDVKDGFWIPPSNFGGALYFLHFGTFYERVPAWAQAHSLIISSAFTIAALWFLRKDKRLAPLFALAIIPVSIMYTASELWRPVMLTRALIPSASVILSLWGIGFTRLPSFGKLTTGSLFIPMAAVALYGYYFDAQAQKFPVRDHAAYIRDEWNEGDCIYNINLASAITFGYYLPSDEYPSYLVPYVGDLSQSLSDNTKTAMGLKEQEIASVDLTDHGCSRVWLLYVETPVISDTEIEAARVMLDRYPILIERTLLDINMVRFTLYQLRLV